MSQNNHNLRILLYVTFNGHKMAHAMALVLKRMLPGVRFAAVTFRDSIEGYYLKNESDGLFEIVISESGLYKETISDGFSGAEDDFEVMEAKYGRPTIWPYVMADRRITMSLNGWIYDEGTSHDEKQLKSILKHRFDALEECFDEFDPDLVLYVHPDTGPGLALALQGVSEARSVPLLVPHRSRIGAYVTLTNTVYNRIDRIEQFYKEIRNNPIGEGFDEASRILNEFRSGGLRYIDTGPDVGKRDPFLKKIVSLLGRVAEVVRNYRCRPYRADPYFRSWLMRRMDDIKATWRSLRIESSVNFEDADYERRYVFIPLHVQPEMSTLLFAPYFVNQTEFVRNVAQSVPANVTVYVKEHPVMITKGLRSPAYLRSLAKIPNVHLVSGDTAKLIKHASAVVTVTGTPAFEALMAGVQVYVFGNVYFDFLPDGIKKLDSWEELKNCLMGTSGNVERTNSDMDLASFIRAIIDCSCEVNLDRLSHLSKRTNTDSMISDDSLKKYCEYVVDNITNIIYD